MLISALYISQSVPVAFLKNGFQVFLKGQNIPYDSISSLLGLLLLPWTLKFLWAPLVDRYGSKRWGHRKSWIIPLQIAGALVLACAAFVDLESQLTQVFFLFLIYSFICATQDIAVDGLAVLSLTRRQHGIGNSMQMGGYYLGEMLGGALILIIFDAYGWTASILALAAFFLIPLIPLGRYKEPFCPPNLDHRPGFKSIREYFKGEDPWWIWLLLLYMGNQILARTLLPSMLMERNMSAEEVGWTIGIFGNTASLAGAILGGIFIESLGRRRSLMLFGFIKIPAFFLLLLIPNLAIPDWQVIGSIMINDFAAGLATVTLYTVMMDKCRLNNPGTDFSIQASLNSVGILVFVILSGIIRASFGLPVLVTVSAGIGLISLWMVWRMRKMEVG